jgi:hypothetical protein
MCPRIRLIGAAAIVLVLGQAAAERAAATVVRDGKAGPSSAAVEAGGHPLRPQGTDKVPPVVVPYSLIGLFQTEDQCLSPFFWPWGGFDPSLRQRIAGGTAASPRGAGSILRRPRPAP